MRGSEHIRPLRRRAPETKAAIIQWDVGTWSQALSFWEQRSGELAGRLGLDIGSRDGGLSLFMALRDCRMVCSDVDGPTPEAKRLHEQHGVADLVSYEQVDAMRIPFPAEVFDVVILKSVLGALDAEEGGLTTQYKAVGEILRVLKPGGRFLFAENMTGSAMHRLLRKWFIPWGKDWHYFTIPEIKDLMSGFGTVDLAFAGFVATLGRREWQRGLLHLLDLGIVPFLPKRMRYAVFGVATK